MNADLRLSACIRGFLFFGDWFKSGKTRSFLTRSTFRGEALKERSEGLLAQRQAALRECWRRGTRSTFASSVSCRVPLSTHRATKNFISHKRHIRHKCVRANSLCFMCLLWLEEPLCLLWLITHRDLALESDCFLVVRVDSDRAQRELARFAAVTSFEKDLA